MRESWPKSRGIELLLAFRGHEQRYAAKIRLEIPDTNVSGILSLNLKPKNYKRYLVATKYSVKV